MRFSERDNYYFLISQQSNISKQKSYYMIATHSSVKIGKIYIYMLVELYKRNY